MLLPKNFIKPMDFCKRCVRKIPEKCTFCPWCGVLHCSGNKIFFLRLRRSTQKYCKGCLSSYEDYNHKYCTECGMMEYRTIPHPRL